MRERERIAGLLEREPGAATDGPPAPGGQLDAVRQEGERLLAAADEAIRKALSNDSETFLRHSRQEGGQ